MTATKQVTEQVKSLYQRLQADSLREDDKVALADVKFPDQTSFIERVYKDKKYFNEMFGSFIPTYDVFRVFTDPKQVVLDIGAHSGYSMIAMRYNHCKAKIVSADAMPANIETLKALRDLDPNYDFVHKAIGSGPGKLRLYLPVMNGYGITGIASTGGTLTDTFDGFVGHFAEQAQHYPSVAASKEDDPRVSILDIDAGSLDDIFEARANEVERIAAVKLDLEGHEGPALRGAERIFRRSKPFLMVEGANRDPAVSEAMLSYGYFHCERHDGKFVPHTAMSMMNDGFWVHPERAEHYRGLGLLTGVVPS